MIEAGRRRIACGSLVLAGIAVATFACAPTPSSRATRGGLRALADSEFLPAVGLRPTPRVDVFYAPGAQSACAWLPDGTFWNGDFELALVDPQGRLLSFATPEPSGPHRDLPAARRRSVLPDATLEVRAFMEWRGGDGDSAQWTRISIRSRGAAAPGLGLAVRSAGEAGHPLHPYAPIGERFSYRVRHGRLLRNGRTIVLVAPAKGVRPPRWHSDLESDAADLDSLAAAERTVWLSTTAGDPGPVGFDVWLTPVGGAAERAGPRGAGDSFEASLTRAALAWRAEQDLGAVVEFPDPRVQAVLVSARRLLVGTRERRNGALHFLGSPLQYRDLYLRDGVRVVRALALLGRLDLSGSALRTLYQFQWPSGPFLSQRGQLDGTGQALWGLRQFAELGGEPRVVASLLDAAVRGGRWIGVQRAASAQRGGPAAGLLPYSDPRDNELARGHLLGTDGWGIAGLRSLVAVLRAAGKSAQADSFEHEARAYEGVLRDVWARETRRQGRPLPPVLEGGGRDWGNLSAAYPCGVYEFDEAPVRALEQFLRARTYVDGLPTIGSRDSLHHYLGFDLTQAALRRGDRRQVEADLHAFIDHAQPDGSGFELAARGGGFGDNLPPHGTFAAMFVDLARSCLAYERGDSLVLLAGLPEGTAGPGWSGRARLHRAPTRFGPLDLDLVPEDGGTAFRLEVALPAPAVVDWPPPARILSLRGNSGTALRLSERRFALPAGNGRWRVELAAEGR